MNIIYVNKIGKKVQRNEIENSLSFGITLRFNGGVLSRQINGNLIYAEMELNELLKRCTYKVNEIEIRAYTQNSIIIYKI